MSGAPPPSRVPAAGVTPRVELVGVDVVVDGAAILAAVDLAVAPGERLAVLGPSGSGKSTLLRVVAGLQPPTRGRVRIDGVDVTDRPAHRRGVGLMFQDHALFPHRDVAGNVGFGLRMLGVDRPTAVARIAAVLALVGLSGFERRDVASLSGGERQRVALARALAPDPAVLLLDEPLGSLDRALRDRLLDDLVEVVTRTRVTVVHVTHDRGEAFAVADRVALVRDGRIAQVGPTVELWRRPADVGVALAVGPATVVAVEVTPTGAVRAPWGELGPVPVAVGVGVGPGPAALVLRPDAVDLVAPGVPGAIAGRVVSSSFRGDHELVRVAVGDTVVEVTRPGAVVAPLGDDVGLVVRAEAGTVVPAPVGDDGAVDQDGRP